MKSNANKQNIIQACTTLFIDYARYVDFGHYDKFVELFSDNAVLNLGFELHGKEKIRRSMTKRSDELRSRHVLSNISIEVQSETMATGIAYLTLYRHIGSDSLLDEAVMLRGPAGVGHYSNRFELTSGGWRISSCHLQFAFRDPEHFP